MTEAGMNVDSMVDRVIAREGGYVNDSADRGGETNFGITIAVARANGWDGSMRDLPRSLAKEIYRKIYYVLPGFDRVGSLSPVVAARLFDIGVSMGPNIAAQFLQRALNALNRQAKDYSDVRVDGQIGAATIGALAGFLKVRGKAGESVLTLAINVQQGERYIALAERRGANENFLYGWLSQRVGAL